MQIIVLDQAVADALRAGTAADPNFRLDPVDAGDGLFVLSIECATDPAFTKFAPSFDSAKKPEFASAVVTKGDRYADVKAEVASMDAEVAALETKR